MTLPPQPTVYTLLSESDSKSDSNESQCESVHFIEKTHLNRKKKTTESTQWHYHHCQQSIRLYTLHSESDSKSESNESQSESVNFIEKNSPKK